MRVVIGAHVRRIERKTLRRWRAIVAYRARVQIRAGGGGQMPERNGSAEWRGDLKAGSGSLVVGDGVFAGAYSFASRFEEGPGTNPEELIAAAHAACFSMALANVLSQAGHTPDRISTTARVTLRNIDGAPTLARVDLETTGQVPGLDQEQFQGYADQAVKDCPVSRALAGIPEIVVTARLG
jgi:osmotically inducible protein OsmC